MGARALVIVDMLNDFLLPGAPLEVPGGRNIIPAIAREIEKARREGIPVIYLCDRHRENDPEFRVWPPHSVKGTRGAEVAEGIEPRQGDILVDKTTYSGFYGTDLEERLEKMGIDELVLCGVAMEICVLYTAADAYMRGFHVTLPDGCTAGLTPEDHAFALKQVRDVLKPRQE